MAVSKENVMQALAWFRKRILAEVQEGWVEDETGKSLMTQEQSEQLASLVDASGEQITQADIDALFADSTTSGGDTVTGSDTASGGDAGEEADFDL